MHAFFEARRDAAPCLRWDGGEVRRYRGRLYALAPLPGPPRTVECEREIAGARHGPGPLRSRAGNWKGVSRNRCPRLSRFRFRAGGESLRPHQGRPRKRLKDLCQEAGVVPWMRDRLPLVYVGEQLAAVGDLWVDADFAAGAGSSALKPVWTGRPRIF